MKQQRKKKTCFLVVMYNAQSYSYHIMILETHAGIKYAKNMKWEVFVN